MLDEIMLPEIGVRIANNLMSSNALDYLEFFLNYSIIELPVPDDMVA